MRLNIILIVMFNVVLIMLDSLRRDHVGAYGNNWIKTPNIDQLVSEGVRFINAYPEALPTIPVRRAMHTGIRTFPNRDYKAAKGDVVLIPRARSLLFFKLIPVIS